jgi:RND family efflux transporter MFP subunit
VKCGEEKKTMKINNFYRLVLPGLIAVLVFASGCSPDKGPSGATIPEVKVTPVITHSVPMYLNLSGTVGAVTKVNIIPRVSGYIEKRYFKEGSYVKAGTPLYLIDPKPFEATLAAVTAQCKDDMNKLNFAQIQAERYEKLASEDATSIEKMQQAVSQRDQMLAVVEKDRANITQARLNLSYTNITSPISGHVQRTYIDVGNLVRRQQDTLTTIVQMDPVYVYFSISRKEGYKMQVLGHAGRLFPAKDIIVQIYLPNGKLFSKTGSIDYISYLIDSTTDCINARAVIPNQYLYGKNDYDLLPGQYVPVKIIYGSIPDALLVPETAVVQSQVGTHVYVAGADNRIELRKVTTGIQHDELREITSGLKVGEKVVCRGVQKVKAGIKIKPIIIPPLSLKNIPKPSTTKSIPRTAYFSESTTPDKSKLKLPPPTVHPANNEATSPPKNKQ